MTARVRAPELRGRGWLNTDGPLTLRELRGRFVLLDFWTFCCINCLHVLEELRPVEAEFADELVVIGVHSPKFVHEADPVALARAVERHAVHHPVLDDPELITWQAYTARAWPTLVLIDPEGYIVGTYAGEGHAHALAATLADLVEQHRERGTLQPGDSPYVAPAPRDSELSFPAKAIVVDDAMLVADAGSRSVVELRGGTVTRRFTGFAEPNGLCQLPDDVAATVGYQVVVADTVGHRLWGLDLASGDQRVVAGDGRQWMQGDPTTSLSSPWDVVWWQDRVWVAMAGVHQLWVFDPRTGAVEIVAGTTNEGLLDGLLPEAWFAQPSGLAVDGDRLWIADSETSALRWLEATEEPREQWRVQTAIGLGLFDFGFKDGDRERARLQHPLGVAVDAEHRVLVADTYNGAIRRFDPRQGLLETIAVGLAEPSGLVDADGWQVVESGEHRIAPLVEGGEVDEFEARTQRPVTELGTVVRLSVPFTAPPGQKVDDRFGPATQLIVTATPPALLRDGEGRGIELGRELQLDPRVGEGVLHVAARAASCDIGDGEGAACRMHQQDWGVPIQITADGPTELVLPLGGTDT
ncbi:thioredoxin-like domain-containing protein [Nocardioides sp. Bht2]|uniref:thioredoxin-like domain-containing protein n=1 Tax=Nocardioides sp. Bht2 TaxID=3392297 RepID=UPI0039B5A803